MKYTEKYWATKVKTYPLVGLIPNARNIFWELIKGSFLRYLKIHTILVITNTQRKVDRIILKILKKNKNIKYNSKLNYIDHLNKKIYFNKKIIIILI